jgi:hypothetical protein
MGRARIVEPPLRHRVHPGRRHNGVARQIVRPLRSRSITVQFGALAGDRRIAVACGRRWSATSGPSPNATRAFTS